MERETIQGIAKALASYLLASPGAASRHTLLASQVRALEAALDKCRDPEGRQELRDALAQLGRRLNPTPTP